MTSNDSSKISLRQSLRKMRAQLSQGEIISAQAAVCEQILRLDAYTQSQNIALYFAYQNEISLKPIWLSAMPLNKQCYFPAMNPDKTLRFLPTTADTALSKNRFDILEPKIEAHEAIVPNQLQLIFMPLLGFDTQCNRLGMGQGCYDRTLAHVQGPMLIGVAYEFQCLPLIMTDEWDIPLDAVITEKKVYWRQS